MRGIAEPPGGRTEDRGVRLLAGLVLYGVSDAMIVAAALGVDPWDVLHQGLDRTFGLGVGTWTNIVGALVLIGWWPLRQRPGPGTVLNVLTIGTVVDLVLARAPWPHSLPVQILVLVLGIALNGVATGLYIGAGLGPGPRDGLTTAFAARGHRIRVVRTGVELAALGCGWLLGGQVGPGTLAYALTIGPIVHVTIPWLALRPAGSGGPGLGRATGPVSPGRPDTVPCCGKSVNCLLEGLR